MRSRRCIPEPLFPHRDLDQRFASCRFRYWQIDDLQNISRLAISIENTISWSFLSFRATLWRLVIV